METQFCNFMNYVKKSEKIKGLFIEAGGTVQGIGFRPFVYNLAAAHKLAGSVRNTGKGAQINVEGEPEKLKSFLLDLKKAGFDARYCIKTVPVKKYKNFSIIKSKITEITADFPQDLALCAECKKELFSQKDRRYLYPFINCVKCGPRFSIIKKLPYDRKNTVMDEFEMCPDCLGEYLSPENRRFHAQPNACGKCGPQLSLYDCGKKIVSKRNDAVRDAAKLLKKGKILAVKGIGGYHLCCDASNAVAVRKLRERKRRPYKPFAVMGNLDRAKKLCYINEFEKRELLSQSAPAVILKKRVFDKMTQLLAPDNPSLAIMLPYAPLHHLLLKELPLLVMTSGNKSGEPIAVNEKEAFSNLKAIADYFLSHNREIENGTDDSIVKFLPGSKEKIIIRRSRGYAPLPVKTRIENDMFAAGGDLKNNFCFIRNSNAYLSQYAGDLAGFANLEFYEKNINKMRNFLKAGRDKAVCDMHPGYHSSQSALKYFKKVNYVQHHYAHMASVIAEYGLKGGAFGCIFDGSGYGEDGNIWGGEFILYSKNKFERVKHFDYFALPGGDICAKEVWRTAVSLLHKYGLMEYMPSHMKSFGFKTAVKMLENNINSPLTSSAGRLFDAVSALTGLKNISTFEAEAAAALEYAACAGKCRTDGIYPYETVGEIICMREMIRAILNDMRKGASAQTVSAKFHNTLADIIVSSACEYNVKKVILGGGVFQNAYLLDMAQKKLLSSGFDVYYNKKVPVNDGGICLGQAYINNLLLKNK